jgi:hypothetical protein
MRIDEMPRLAWKPHAVVLVERPPIGQIHVACAVGTACLRIELKGNSHTYLRQALAGLGRVHSFWKVTGVVVNYTADGFSIRYGVDGLPVETMDEPATVPVVYLEPIH